MFTLLCTREHMVIGLEIPYFWMRCQINNNEFIRQSLKYENFTEIVLGCFPKNTQSRKQRVFSTDSSLLVHATETDPFLGLVTDIGLYYEVKPLHLWVQFI